MLNEEVVGKAIAVRLGYGDAMAGGAIHECNFCEFTHTAGTEISGGHIFFSFHEVRSRDPELFAIVKQEEQENKKGADGIRAFSCGAPGRAHSLGGESPLQTRQGEVLASLMNNSAVDTALRCEEELIGLAENLRKYHEQTTRDAAMYEQQYQKNLKEM